MLARIAHELYWLGRNTARAEHTARLLDGVFQSDLQGRPDDPAGVTLGWAGVLAMMGGRIPADRPVHRDDVLESLTLDSENPTSVISCVARAREGARTVRDVISAEMWEAINTTNLTLTSEHPPELSARLRSGPYSVYQYVKERSALFWGLTSRTMLHDDARAFLTAGGRIESADMILRMLRVAFPPGREDDDALVDGQALALLQAVGGFQAFRRAVPSVPNARPVARFLLYERAFPDSVAACVEATLDVLQHADSNPRSSEPILRLSRLVAELEFRARAEEVEPEPPDLAESFERVQRELVLIDGDIAERYFAGAAAAAGVHAL